VTCQLVTVHKVPIERLATVNHASNIFFVGDACYVPQPLSLGALRGNRFQVSPCRLSASMAGVVVVHCLPLLFSVWVWPATVGDSQR
jgi:hypothetical protein